jgi:hypothetical protein
VREPKLKGKSYVIHKRLVWEAWLKVTENGGAAGADGVTIEQFAQNLSGNLFKLWNRMSSGSYVPGPVRAVEIPKKGKRGGMRVLGIPNVVDRVAETAAAMVLEPGVEPIFHKDSYGYRPGRAALDAVAVWCIARTATAVGTTRRSRSRSAATRSGPGKRRTRARGKSSQLPTGARPGDADGDEPPSRIMAASPTHDPRPRRPRQGDQPRATRLISVLHRVLPERGVPTMQAHRSRSNALGAGEVQATGAQPPTHTSMATAGPDPEPRAVRALEVSQRRVLKPGGTSRMSREAHVRICGGRRV